jgi:hypothetical protein
VLRLSKYTTEVRYICEEEAGLEASKGYADVKNIIELSRPKIFNFEYPIFDETYREVLETKILKHFYTREIGFESVGLWKLKLDTKMNEIMPYYNLLYSSSLLEFNPLYTKDLTRKKDVEINKADNLVSSQEVNNTVNRDTTSVTNETDNAVDSRNVDGSVSNVGSENGTSSVDTVNVDLYSDTPQGALTGVENETYLTNARKITNGTDSEYDIDRTNTETSDINETNTTNRAINNSNTGSEDVNSESVSNAEQNKSGNSVEDYLERVYGYESGSASKLLKEYRETFLNIDLMVINELEELFMQLW